MVCPGPANMGKCDPKSRCVFGDCEGRAYDPADPCPNGGEFNTGTCTCEDQWQTIIIVVRLTRYFYTGNPPFQPCDPKYYYDCDDSTGNRKGFLTCNYYAWGPGDLEGVVVSTSQGEWCPTECGNTQCSPEGFEYLIYNTEGTYVGGTWPVFSSSVWNKSSTGWSEGEVHVVYGFGETAFDSQLDAEGQIENLPPCPPP